MEHFADRNVKGTVCPRCGGSIFPFVGFYAGMIYECKRCGYHGPLALKKIEKLSKKKNV